MASSSLSSLQQKLLEKTAHQSETNRQRLSQLRPYATQLDWDMMTLLSGYDSGRLKTLFAFWFPAGYRSVELPEQRTHRCYLCDERLIAFTLEVVCSDCMDRVFDTVTSRCIVHQTLKMASRVIGVNPALEAIVSETPALPPPTLAEHLDQISLLIEQLPVGELATPQHLGNLSSECLQPLRHYGFSPTPAPVTNGYASGRPASPSAQTTLLPATAGICDEFMLESAALVTLDSACAAILE